MLDSDDLIEFFAGYTSPERYAKMLNVLENRTRFLTVVLEDIYQTHNASAVLRSCDCLGIQDVHIIENRNRYELNPDVVLGSEKWLTLHRYNKTEDNTLEALENLRAGGYRLAATTPETEMTIDELPADRPVALMFGTELHGLTETAVSMADYKVKIPMFGFTQSFNISVSAAICLFEFTRRMRSGEIEWKLNKQQRNEILLEWLRKSVKKSHLLERAFRKRRIRE